MGTGQGTGPAPTPSPSRLCQGSTASKGAGTADAQAGRCQSGVLLSVGVVRQVRSAAPAARRLGKYTGQKVRYLTLRATGPDPVLSHPAMTSTTSVLRFVLAFATTPLLVGGMAECEHGNAIFVMLFFKSRCDVNPVYCYLRDGGTSGFSPVVVRVFQRPLSSGILVQPPLLSANTRSFTTPSAPSAHSPSFLLSFCLPAMPCPA